MSRTPELLLLIKTECCLNVTSDTKSLFNFRCLDENSDIHFF